MKGVAIPKVWERGVIPTTYLGNGMDVVSRAGTLLAEYTNMLAGRRKKILYSKGIDFGQLVGVAAGEGFYGAFRTGPAIGAVVVAMLVLPPDNTGSSLSPRLRWNLLPAGSSAFTQPSLRFGKRRTGTALPSDIMLITQRWDGRNGTSALLANQVYQIWCEQTDYARCMAATIYEEPFDRMFLNSVSPSSDGGVNPEQFAIGAPILDRALDDVQDTLHVLWKQGRPRLFNWGAVANSGASSNIWTTTSTTYVNPLDTSYTDWNANAPGFWVWPQYHQAYKPGNNDVPVEFCISTIGNGVVAFRTAAGTDIATITVNSEFATVLLTTTGNLNGNNDSDKIDVLFKADATKTLTVYTCSGWEYKS